MGDVLAKLRPSRVFHGLEAKFGGVGGLEGGRQWPASPCGSALQGVAGSVSSRQVVSCWPVCRHLAAQAVDVGAQACSGYDTCNEHDSEGRQGFKRRVVVDHGDGSLRVDETDEGEFTGCKVSMCVQVGSQLLFQLCLQVFGADDSHMG